VSGCQLVDFLLVLLLLLLFAFISYYILQNAKYFAEAWFGFLSWVFRSQSDIVRS